MWKVITGQISLIACCVFYLIWWSISYKPGVSVNRLGGINGFLLLVTAIFGIAGVALSVYGVNELPTVRTAKFNGGHLALAGIVLYIALLLITRFVFHRAVTTELLLITGWLVLELTVISSLNSAGSLSEGGFWLLVCVLLAAFVISMILYVLYYRMEPMKAFYAAMVPLITEGVSMGIVLLVTLLRITRKG